jgi:hypothetical protein
MKLYSTFAGEKTGFASIEAGDIGIVSMGHQILPSKNLTLFGFEKGFTRMSRESGPARTWVQVVSHDAEKPSQDLWSEIHLEEGPEEITLQLRNENFGEEKHLMLVFFLKGEEFYIGKERKTFQLFEQHKGEALPISFGNDNKKIEIIPEFDATMYVIPVMGAEEYLGANYLLAYDLIHFGKLYTFHISFVN